MLQRFLRRLTFIFRRHDDLAEELEFHRQMKADELRAQGLRESEITSTTQRVIGNDLLAREQAKDVWIPHWLQDSTQDFKFGLRVLVKDRRFSAAAIIALALGIGVNNSVFTIMNAALFRPLPFEKSEELVSIRLTDGKEDSPLGGGFGVSYADYLDWTRASTSFEGLMADQAGTVNLSEASRPAERLRGAYVTANTLRLLRVSPLLGRGFLAEDQSAGAATVAMISHDLWQSRYGGDPDVIGAAIRINGTPAAIVGVMPPQFGYPMMPQIWQPITAMPRFDLSDRKARVLNVAARLNRGVDAGQARLELQTLNAQIAQAYPDSHQGLQVDLGLMHDAHAGGRQAWVILGTLMAAVTLVLLIACANVASLMLARTVQRSREIALRASLGASRWRIVRQLMIECLLISACAALGGLALSRYLAHLMAVAFNVYDVSAPGGTVKPYWVDISIDAITMAFIGFLSLAVSVVVGVIPAWHVSKANANDVLKDGGRGSGGGTSRARRLTGALLIGQLALTVMLLTGAGLLARNFFRLYFTDLVVDTTGVVTMRIVLPPAKYATVDKQRQFVRMLDDRLQEVRPFSAVALGSDIPLQPLGFGTRTLVIEDRPWPQGEQPPTVFSVSTGPRYLETLRIPVVLGRGFSAADELSGQEGVIVNQRFAMKFFPDGAALGKRVRLTAPNIPPDRSPAYTIVGVARALPNFFRFRASEPVVYVPINADPGPQTAVSVIVRTADSTAGKTAAASALRELVSALDPDLPVFGIQTLDDAVAMGRYSPQVIGSWFATIALIALVLATVGLYALTAHSVAQRTHEIGVRMALGAEARQVMWLFVRRTIVQLAIGVTVGVAMTVAISRTVGAFFSDTNPRDPVTLVSVCTLLIVVSLCATVLPSRRAARIDPSSTLRGD
jgi:predicted permease